MIDANGYFCEPCEFRETGKDGLFYVAPRDAGYARMKPDVLRAQLSFGSVWSKEKGKGLEATGCKTRAMLLQIRP